MTISRVKTWIAGEVLTAADLNAEINNILNNTTALVTPLTANLIWNPDATYDIGASGASRPRDLFLSRNAVIGGTLTLSGALTYGGVTLAAAVTGTGNMALSASPTFTGTVNAAALTLSGLLTATSPAISTSITTPSTTFTAFAGATTLLTLGGTGATSVLNVPGTLDASGTTGALTNAGGFYNAKAIIAGGAISSSAGLSGTTGTFIDAITSTKNFDGILTGLTVTNTNAGTTALSEFRASNGTVNLQFGVVGTGYTAYRGLVANGVYIYTGNSAGAAIQLDDASAPFNVYSTTNKIASFTASALTLSNALIGPATASVFNTVSSTVNAFGAASTALNIGHASGTTTALGNWSIGGTLGVTGALTATGGLVLPGTAANITTGANFISYGGTDAGLSFDSSNNATLSAGLTVSGPGPHAIGGATNTRFQLLLTGTFAGAADVHGFRVIPTLTPGDNISAYIQSLGGTINESGAGTHVDFAGLLIDPPTIGAGVAALTNASTLKITAAPTGATNNYSLWIDAGAPRLDEPVSAGAGVGTLTNVPNAGGGNPTVYFKMYQGTTAYAIPGFAL